MEREKYMPRSENEIQQNYLKQINKIKFSGNSY